MPLAAFSALLVLALTGCQALCVRNSDCPVEYLCAASGLCELPPEPPPPTVPTVDAAPDSTGGGIPGLPDGSAPDLGDTPDAAGDMADAAELPPDDF